MHSLKLIVYVKYELLHISHYKNKSCETEQNFDALYSTKLHDVAHCGSLCSPHWLSYVCITEGAMINWQVVLAAKANKLAGLEYVIAALSNKMSPLPSQYLL